MSSTAPRTGIRLGIDFGNTKCRLAYVHPDGERAVVTVSLSMTQFRQCFPIAEKMPVNDLYVSPFFPGITQRSLPNFAVDLQDKRYTAEEIVARIIAQGIAETETFAGRKVEGLLICHSMCAPGESIQTLQNAINVSGLQGSLSNDAEGACAFFRNEDMEPDEHQTVLVFAAGYCGAGVAAARITPRGVRVLSKTSEEGLLAGNVIDFMILQTAVTRIREAKILLSDAPSITPWSTLQFDVEKAKQSVREADSFEFDIPVKLTPELDRPLRMRLNGHVFRQLIHAQMDGAMTLVDEALEENGLQENEVDTVLLVGGTTHLPTVTSRVRERFPNSKVRHLPPEAVAAGAAILATQPQADAGSEASPVARSPSNYGFRPRVLDVVELLEIVRPGSATAGAPDSPAAATEPAGAPETPNVAPQPAPREPNPELAGLRERIMHGVFDSCRDDLKALADSIHRRLDGQSR